MASFIDVQTITFQKTFQESLQKTAPICFIDKTEGGKLIRMPTLCNVSDLILDYYDHLIWLYCSEISGFQM